MNAPLEHAPQDTITPPGFDIPGETSCRFIGDPGPLFGALAKAQGAFQPIPRNRTVTVRTKDRETRQYNGEYTFSYATLDVILEATRPALSAAGLCIMQPFHNVGDDPRKVRTILGHSSGCYLQVETTVPRSAAIQDMGSALSYLRRYQVQALLGVSSEEDDDGNRADDNEITARHAREPQPRVLPARSEPGSPPVTAQKVSRELHEAVMAMAKERLVGRKAFYEHARQAAGGKPWDDYADADARKLLAKLQAMPMPEGEP